MSFLLSTRLSTRKELMFCTNQLCIAHHNGLAVLQNHTVWPDYTKNNYTLVAAISVLITLRCILGTGHIHT